MRPIVIYDPFAVVIVPFPFTDKLQTKRRPALVLSHTLHQKESKHITLLMITSAKNSDWNSDYPIQNLEATGLTAPSIIRQKIFTIDSRLIIECLGRLLEIDKQEIQNRIKAHLSF
jgi:mRNA interferase MazF